MKRFLIAVGGEHNENDRRVFDKIVADLGDALRPAGFRVTDGEYRFDLPVVSIEELGPDLPPNVEQPVEPEAPKKRSRSKK